MLTVIPTCPYDRTHSQQSIGHTHHAEDSGGGGVNRKNVVSVHSANPADRSDGFRNVALFNYKFFVNILGLS